jgi:hypothetical protein
MLNELYGAHREELFDYRVWRQHYLAFLHLHRRPTVDERSTRCILQRQ